MHLAVLIVLGGVRPYCYSPGCPAGMQKPGGAPCTVDPHRGPMPLPALLNQLLKKISLRLLGLNKAPWASTPVRNETPSTAMATSRGAIIFILFGAGALGFALPERRSGSPEIVRSDHCAANLKGARTR